MNESIRYPSNGFRFVSATQKTEEEFWKESPLGKSLNVLLDLCPFDVTVFFSNGRGLPEVYNEVLASESEEVTVFVHDDVSIQDLYLFKKLKSALETNELVGLAGTTKFSLSWPSLWHMSPKNSHVGAVAHEKDGCTWMCSYGKSSSRCLLVDGLFMATVPKRLKGLRFDERFKFHHYDLDFCLQAYKAGLRTSVCPIWVVHSSMGEWDNQAWHESNKKFVEKWSRV